jgi:hypothetical protein
MLFLLISSTPERRSSNAAHTQLELRLGPERYLRGNKKDAVISDPFNGLSETK